MYQALVAKVTVSKHPNADRLYIANVNGYQIVTGAGLKDGDLVLYFNEGGALSHEFCYHNNEYRAGKGENKDPNKFGYFNKNRRILTIKLRGIASEGYCCPISCLEWTGADLSTLTEGMQLDSLNGHQICYKYVTPATQRAIDKAQKEGKQYREIPTFHKHFDTKQLRDNIGRIPLGAILFITAKIHSTSGRTGQHQVDMPLATWKNKWNRAVSRWPKLQIAPQKAWMYVSGSRNVTYDPFNQDNNGFDTDTHSPGYRRVAENMFQGKLQRGETVYYEICFCNSQSKPLFTHSIGAGKEVKDDEIRKELAKLYGPTMNYTYGCKPNETKIFIYRITGLNAHGSTYEYAWADVQRRAAEMGLSTVPVLDTLIYAGPDDLLKRIRTLCDKPSVLDPTHIEEGVCVRIEHPEIPDTMKILKWKAASFCALEGIRKNDDTYVDLEEIS